LLQYDWLHMWGAPFALVLFTIIVYTLCITWIQLLLVRRYDDHIKTPFITDRRWPALFGACMAATDSCTRQLQMDCTTTCSFNRLPLAVATRSRRERVHPTAVIP
jgi:hypothetical protein